MELMEWLIFQVDIKSSKVIKLYKFIKIPILIAFHLDY